GRRIDTRSARSAEAPTTDSSASAPPPPPASASARAQDEQKAKKRPREREAPTPGEVLTALRDADLLPCLYFLPGRRVVEDAAVSAALHMFTTPEEQALIREEVGIWLEHLPKEDRRLQQVHS